MIYTDLRDFIEQVEKLGTLRHVEDVDAHFELGGITEVAAGLAECPALLFDKIKGYPRGFLVFTNVTTSPQRAAIRTSSRRVDGFDPKSRHALEVMADDRVHSMPRLRVYFVCSRST